MSARVLFVLLAAAPAAAKVSRVVVYPDRAQVIRSEDVPCGPAAVARFERIPPSADPSTLRAQVAGGTLEGLRWAEQPRGEEFAPKLRELDAAIRAAELERRTLGDAVARAQGDDRLGQSYGEVALAMIGREMAAAAPAVKAWNAAIQSTLDARVQSGAATAEATSKMRALDDKLADLRRVVGGYDRVLVAFSGGVDWAIVVKV